MRTFNERPSGCNRVRNNYSIVIRADIHVQCVSYCFTTYTIPVTNSCPDGKVKGNVLYDFNSLQNRIFLEELIVI